MIYHKKTFRIVAMLAAWVFLFMDTWAFYHYLNSNLMFDIERMALSGLFFFMLLLLPWVLSYFTWNVVLHKAYDGEIGAEHNALQMIVWGFFWYSVLLYAPVWFLLKP